MVASNRCSTFDVSELRLVPNRTSISCPTGTTPRAALGTVSGALGAVDVTSDVRGGGVAVLRSRVAQAYPLANRTGSIAAAKVSDLFMSSCLLPASGAMDMPRHTTRRPWITLSTRITSATTSRM